VCGKRGSEAAGVTATFNFFPALSKREKSKKKKKKKVACTARTLGHARQTEDSTN
jgi:hypothetical protein